jgi:hypothetical protein
MITRDYQTNRASFPVSELVKHRGSWVAFSSDGRSIIASGRSLTELEERLAALGIDAGQVMLESVPGLDDDVQLGAGE